MMNSRDLFSSLKLGEAVGKRQSGHFDRDSKCVIGPEPFPSLDDQVSVDTIDHESTIQVEAFEKIVDEEAGLIRYRQLGK